MIADSCRDRYGSTITAADPLNSQLTSISSTFDVDIWIVKAEGTIVYRTDDIPAGSVIEAFDPSDQGRGRYVIGDYYGMFEDSMLSVTAPISANFNTYGYVVLHQSLTGIYEVRDQILNIIYITFLVIFLLSFVILWIIRKSILQPLKKITRCRQRVRCRQLKLQAGPPFRGRDWLPGRHPWLHGP